MFNDTTSEEWRPVIGYEEFYSINQCGDVCVTTHRHGGKQVGDILKQDITNKGYARVALTKDKITKKFSVHRLVGFAFIGKPQDEQTQINHKDGNPLNNCVENLEWCTPMENIIHSIETGLKPILAKGEEHARAKLTQLEVNEIRSLYESGSYTQKELGATYGVTQSCIWTIVRHKKWKD